MRDENIISARGLSGEPVDPVKGFRDEEWGNDGVEAKFSERERPKKDIIDFFVNDLGKGKRIVLKELLDQIEKGVISKTLCVSQGNQKRAARILGIKYTTLNVKIKRHNIKILKVPSV